MKKYLPVLAIAALFGAAGCSKPDDTASIQNNAEVMANALEARADNLEALADANANASVDAMLEGAADNLDDHAGNLRDPSDNAAAPR